MALEQITFKVVLLIQSNSFKTEAINETWLKIMSVSNICSELKVMGPETEVK